MRRSGRAARAASGGACSSGTAPRRGVNRQRVQPEELEEEEESEGGAGAVREAGSSESQRDGEGATDDADFDLVSGTAGSWAAMAMHVYSRPCQHRTVRVCPIV